MFSEKSSQKDESILYLACMYSATKLLFQGSISVYSQINPIILLELHDMFKG